MEIKDYIEQNQLKNPSYIGDGVYVAHDGHQVWLMTQRYSGEIVDIVLDQYVFQALINYIGTTNATGESA